MKTTPFTEMAMLFRGHIVKQWSLAQSGTPSQNAATLTDAAIQNGYVTRSRPVPGAAIAEWVLKPNNTPLWAAQTALKLMLETGWRPGTSLEWCGMAALFYKANRNYSLNELLTRLPASIDKLTAAGWLTAAIEEEAHYRSSRKYK
ncbi:hypothetical protein HVZ37_22620 (plasmid) [Citrobacter sp. RHB35-C17]|nr:hypothetical protein HVZ37_22620 [Citrobacter sp. RHB35-C17]